MIARFLAWLRSWRRTLFDPDWYDHDEDKR